MPTWKDSQSSLFLPIIRNGVEFTGIKETLNCNPQFRSDFEKSWTIIVPSSFYIMSNIKVGILKIFQYFRNLRKNSNLKIMLSLILNMTNQLSVTKCNEARIFDLWKGVADGGLQRKLQTTIKRASKSVCGI